MLRMVAVAAGGVAMAVSLAGCLGGGGGGSNAGGSGSGGIKLTADQVLNKAAHHTANAQSFKMSMAMKATTQEQGKPTQVHMGANGVYKMKPHLAFDMKINKLSMGSGSNLPSGMEERLLNNTLYMKMPMLERQTNGKPWVKFSLSELSSRSGVNMSQMLNQTQQANPANYTKMLTASKNVHKVGTETVNGVQTTHYAGTYDAQKAMSKLSSSHQSQVRSQLQSMRAIHFDLWTDNKQLPRKLTMHGNANSTNFTVTENFTQFGAPVSVSAPPATQTADGAQLSH